MPIEDIEGKILNTQEVSKLISPGQEMLVHLQEVINSPSPLAQMLDTPEMMEWHERKRSQRAPISLDHEQKAASLESIALYEEQRQGRYLKAALQNASSFLEYEIRRADAAELRAREALELAAADESSRRQAEEQYGDLALQNKNFQMQLASMTTELERLTYEKMKLEERTGQLEELNREVNEERRQYHNALLEYRDHEDGRKEGARLAMMKRFEDGVEEGRDLGYSEGYKRGRRDGFNEGVQVGRREGFGAGFKDGRRLGREEERRNALDAFDRFIDDKIPIEQRKEAMRKSVVESSHQTDHTTGSQQSSPQVKSLTEENSEKPTPSPHPTG